MSLLPTNLLKMRTKFEERLDIGNSRTRDALARLIKDHEDAVALIAVFEENREAITAAVTPIVIVGQLCCRKYFKDI